MILDTIHCADCENAADYYPEKSIDLIFGSPPYGDIIDYGDPDAQCDPDCFPEWMGRKARAFHHVLKDTGSFIMNIGDIVKNGSIHPYIHKTVVEIQENCGFSVFMNLFWDKGCSAPTQKNRFRRTTEYLFWFVKNDAEEKFKFFIDPARVPYQDSTIMRYRGVQTTRHKRDSSKEVCPECGEQMKYRKHILKCPACYYEVQQEMKKVDLHPLGALPSTLLRMGSEAKNTGYNVAVFPKSLPSYFIPIATEPGDIVMDPFAGNGTTALAAMDLDRRFVCFELVPKNHQDCVERIDAYRKKLNSGLHSQKRSSILIP